MDQAITVGAVLWTFIAIGGVVGVLAILIWVLSLFADAFKH
jgi:hypothetical protein